MRTKNYRYYHGEDECPFSNRGKSFWWTIERYAHERNDNKEKDELSQSMVYYLKEKMWDGDGQHDTTLEEMLKRAGQMYLKGVWSRSYLNSKSYTFQEAEREN